MKIVGKKVKLRFGEPWDDSRVSIGVITMVDFATDGSTYFLVEDILSHDKFVVSNRYVGEDVMQISTEKRITVDVAIPNTGEFTFDDPNYLNSLTFYGIGPLEYIG